MFQKRISLISLDSLATRACSRRASTWVRWCCALLAATLVLALAAGPAQAYTRAWLKATDNGPRSVLGGDGVAYLNKLWAIDIGANVAAKPAILSSSDGVHWTTVLNPAPEEAKYGRLIAFKGRLWIFGRNVYGRSATLYSMDGVTWTRTASTVAVYESSRIAQKDNKLWLFDSTNNNRILSSGDGMNWTVVNSTAACLKRYLPAMVSFGGKLWLLGGSTTVDLSAPQNDVWSSADGITWTLVTSHANWSPRINHAATVFEGKIWIIGGYGADVWNSANGKDWARVNSAAPWGIRSAMSPVVFNSRLWIAGGYDNLGKNKADVWYVNQLAAGAPTLGAIATQQAREGQAYIGPDPLLTGGSEPITWSLTAGPAGMRIVPQTGIVYWSIAHSNGSQYQVTIKATNSAGAAQVSWALAVAPIVPHLNAAAFAPGTEAKVSWSRVPGITGYLIQRDDAPDFASPVQTVTVSSTTLERSFSGLTNGQTNWFRVRGIRLDGVSNAWSNVTSTTQDTVAPLGTLKVNGGVAVVNSSAVTLNMQAQDPGTRPSGVAQMRLSTDGRNWMGWEPYAATRSVRLNSAQKNFTYYAQFQDRVGNVSTPASVSFTLALSPICVDASASATGANGTPARPYPSIRQAIAAATASRGDIYVAEGTYPEPLVLKSNMTLLGGFPKGKFELALRSPGYYKSQITSSADTGFLVTMEQIVNTQIDGFRIGNHQTSRATGFHFGIYGRLIGQDCYIGRCVISGLTTPQHHQGELAGGGIYLDHASPLITGCTIENCSADYFSGIACHATSAPLIDRCLVRNNYAYGYWAGGGPFRTFVAGIGGGVTIDVANPIIRNSILAQNQADGTGTGIYQNNNPTSKAVVQNCTIFGNQIGYFGCDSAQITNCIIWDNTIGYSGRPGLVQYSCIQGWTGGTGNIAVDPQFVNRAAGDFHLMPSSPCIDAGKFIAGLSTDFDGNPRGIIGYAGTRGDGSHYDMGAYEYVLPAPVIAPAAGAYSGRLTITMTGPAGATIRYTLDGTDPTATTPPYTGPITWPGGTLQRLTVKAQAYKAGLTPSAICVRYYIFRY